MKYTDPRQVSPSQDGEDNFQRVPSSGGAMVLTGSPRWVPQLAEVRESARVSAV